MIMQQRYRARTTTGCLTCRKRRKKCNEDKPICIGCKRNHLICTWPTDGKTKQDVSLVRAPAGQNLSTDTDVAVIPAHASRQNGGANAQIKMIYSTLSVPPSIDLMPGLRKESDRHMFEHYMNVTALKLAGRHEPQNAFLSHIIPIAYQDARVVQSVLAISGAQLCFRSDQFEHPARSHYAVTLRSVKHSLLDWRALGTVELTGLLTMTLFLCMFEIVIGNIDGNFLHHVRASRTLLLELRYYRANQVDRCTLDLLTEFYAFFAINTNITLTNDLPINRYMPEDPFLSPKSLAELNKGTSIYGVLFGSAHELVGLIMPIARSARYFLEHQNTEQRNINLRKYEREILAWKHKPLHSSSEAQSDGPDPYEAAGQLWQQSILVFLYTTFNGRNPPSPELIAKVDACIEAAFLVTSTIPLNHSIKTTLPWPGLICASCMLNPIYRDMIKGVMSVSETDVAMLSVNRNFEFMLKLWEEQDLDDRVYGPYGIELVMRKYNFNLCVS
ncbi:hypothetical protein IQ07DRAFT_582466 [Pyrenochaeta sp. DS3sAY3a]|nr:hypothetical protein IQ07DRAFT_582466 [Pyrenochaeta sp. DS3sAY3a]